MGSIHALKGAKLCMVSGAGCTAGMFERRCMDALMGLSGRCGWCVGACAQPRWRSFLERHAAPVLPAMKTVAAPAAMARARSCAASSMPGCSLVPHTLHHKSLLHTLLLLSVEPFYDEEDAALAAMEFARPRKISKSMSASQLAGMEAQAGHAGGRPPREQHAALRCAALRCAVPCCAVLS